MTHYDKLFIYYIDFYAYRVPLYTCTGVHGTREVFGIYWQMCHCVMKEQRAFHFKRWHFRLKTMALFFVTMALSPRNDGTFSRAKPHRSSVLQR